MADIHKAAMSWLVEMYKNDNIVLGEALQQLRERDQVRTFRLYTLPKKDVCSSWGFYGKAAIQHRSFTPKPYTSPIDIVPTTGE